MKTLKLWSKEPVKPVKRLIHLTQTKSAEFSSRLFLIANRFLPLFTAEKKVPTNICDFVKINPERTAEIRERESCYMKSQRVHEILKGCFIHSFAPFHKLLETLASHLSGNKSEYQCWNSTLAIFTSLCFHHDVLQFGGTSLHKITTNLHRWEIQQKKLHCFSPQLKSSSGGVKVAPWGLKHSLSWTLK